MRRTSAIAVLAAGSLVAAPLVLTACADADAADPALVSALCAAADAAAAADAETAADTFESDAHRPLHELADRVAEVDRAIAARLLEAKFDVETAVREEALAPAPLIHARLETLIDRFRDALEAIDLPAPAC